MGRVYAFPERQGDLLGRSSRVTAQNHRCVGAGAHHITLGPANDERFFFQTRPQRLSCARRCLSRRERRWHHARGHPFESDAPLGLSACCRLGCSVGEGRLARPIARPASSRIVDHACSCSSWLTSGPAPLQRGRRRSSRAGSTPPSLPLPSKADSFTMSHALHAAVALAVA